MPLSPRGIHTHPPSDTCSSHTRKTLSQRPKKDNPTQQTPISRLEKGLPTSNLNDWEGNMRQSKVKSDQTKGNASVHVIKFVVAESIIHSDR